MTVSEILNHVQIGAFKRSSDTRLRTMIQLLEDEYIPQNVMETVQSAIDDIDFELKLRKHERSASQ